MKGKEKVVNDRGQKDDDGGEEKVDKNSQGQKD